MLDRWVMNIHNEFGWTAWKRFNLWGHKFSTMKICLTFRSGNTMMDDGEYASLFDMSEIWDGLQRFNHHD